MTDALTPPLEAIELHVLPYVNCVTTLSRLALTCSRLYAVVKDIELWKRLALFLLTKRHPLVPLDTLLESGFTVPGIVRTLHDGCCQRCGIRPILRIDWRLGGRCCKACLIRWPPIRV